ncbi:MAG: molybdopterin-dependent oxidoreductase, partial [bacterium]|nr:molybdopterin-dependent oxidoreductase [bacterium]
MAAGTAADPQHAAERTAAGTAADPQHAGTTGAIAVEGYFAPSDSDPLPVVGAHFCEVEVDHATGQVRVLRYVAAQDVGRVINPLGCRGQVEGGLHHGIGYALLEELRHDE